MLEQGIGVLKKRHICLEEGTLEADPLSQQDTSEMLLDAWLKACLQRICSYVSSLLSYLPCVMETFQGSWGCTVVRAWARSTESGLEFDSATQQTRCFPQDLSLLTYSMGGPFLPRGL